MFITFHSFQFSIKKIYSDKTNKLLEKEKRQEKGHKEVYKK